MSSAGFRREQRRWAESHVGQRWGDRRHSSTGEAAILSFFNRRRNFCCIWLLSNSFSKMLRSHFFATYMERIKFQWKDFQSSSSRSWRLAFSGFPDHPVLFSLVSRRSRYATAPSLSSVISLIEDNIFVFVLVTISLLPVNCQYRRKILKSS